MPRMICKLTDPKTKTDYYFEWSTVVDAPVTFGQSLEDFKEYYRNEYGQSSVRDFEDRMKRVEAKGTSSQIYDNVDELISGNRAGDDETELTKEEILEQYCINQNNP